MSDAGELAFGVLDYNQHGDSMIGWHILDGDVVVLEHRPEPRNGQIASLIDRASTLKTFVMKGGKPYQKAENPKSRPRPGAGV